MTLGTAIRNLQTAQGWSDETLLGLLLDYLEGGRQNMSDVMNYLVDRAEAVDEEAN
jgi:hypothetical protein